MKKEIFRWTSFEVNSDVLFKDNIYISYELWQDTKISLKNKVGAAPTRYPVDDNNTGIQKLFPGYPEASSTFSGIRPGYPDHYNVRYPVFAKHRSSGTLKRYVEDPKISVTEAEDLYRLMFISLEHEFSTHTVSELHREPLPDFTSSGVIAPEEAFKPLAPEPFVFEDIRKKIPNDYLNFMSEGWFAAPYLIFDVDSKNLEESRAQTITLIDAIYDLICEYRGPNKPLKKHKISLGIVYSGSKGFHVYVPTGLIGWQLPTLYKKISEILAARYSLTCLDTKIYDSARIIRVPGTVNQKNGDLCCVISEKMLREKSVEYIQKYSRRLKAWLISEEEGDKASDKKPRRPALYHLPHVERNTLSLPIFISRLCMTKVAPYKEYFDMGDHQFSAFVATEAWEQKHWQQVFIDLERGSQRWGVNPAPEISTHNNTRTRRSSGRGTTVETVLRYPTKELENFFSREVSFTGSLSYQDAVNYIKSLDFRPLFGLPTNGQNFSCLYHEDHNPSATVIAPTAENPVWLYRCYANSAEHPCKSIIDLTIDYYRFLGEELDVKAAVRRIGAALGIEVLEGRNTVAAEEIRDMLEDTIAAVNEAHLDYNTYSNIYLVRALYRLGLSLAEHFDVSPQNFYFGASTKEIAKIIGYEKQPYMVTRMINLCHCLGWIRKVDPDEVPAWYRNNSVINGLRQARGTEINYYQLTATWNPEEIIKNYQLWISYGGTNQTALQYRLCECFGIEKIAAYEIAALVDACNSIIKNEKTSDERKREFSSFVQRLVDYREEHSSVQVEARLRRAASHHQTGRGDTSRIISRNFELCVELHNLRECLLARYLRRRGYDYRPLIFYGDMLETPVSLAA